LNRLVGLSYTANDGAKQPKARKSPYCDMPAVQGARTMKIEQKEPCPSSKREREDPGWLHERRLNVRFQKENKASLQGLKAPKGNCDYANDVERSCRGEKRGRGAGGEDVLSTGQYSFLAVKRLRQSNDKGRRYLKKSWEIGSHAKTGMRPMRKRKKGKCRRRGLGNIEM